MTRQKRQEDFATTNAKARNEKKLNANHARVKNASLLSPYHLYTRSCGSTGTHRATFARKHNPTYFVIQSEHIAEGPWIKDWYYAAEASYSWVC